MTELHDAKAADEASGAVGSFLLRLAIGSVAWGIGTAALVGLMLLSAIPYGGGSAGPLYLIVPWTAAVVFWVLRPLRHVPQLSAPATRLLLFALAFGVPMGAMYWWLGSGGRQRASAASSFASGFAPHAAYFDKACKKAGRRVLRQAQDVAGFVVYGIGAKPERQDLDRKGFVGDVYSQIDTSFDPEAAFVSRFLTRTEWDAQWHVPTADETNRYSFVEIPAEVDAIPGFHRYTDASAGAQFKTYREFVKHAASAYGVRIEDISSAEDREHWVAGTRWSVFDVKTGEELGEFKAYAIDPLQGQTSFSGGFGQAGEPWAPWLRAGHVQYRVHGIRNACPEKDMYQKVLNSLDFVRSVLVPLKQAVRIIPAR